MCGGRLGGGRARRRGPQRDADIRQSVTICFEEGAFGKKMSIYFQAGDGIRDHAWSRGLGDVYKRLQWEKYLKNP
ncbi:hypothetical protein BN3590_00809 [Clostridium sp. C105KSO15]|nr:hypothetical protein BN3590_00809 [Clostridium sp. C105KSO15]